MIPWTVAPYRSPTSRVYPNSCPLSWWCHPTMLSSAVPFSYRLQSFPASRFIHLPYILPEMLLLLLSHFSCVRLCATPQTAAHQAPLSPGLCRQEHWSGLPLPSPFAIDRQWQLRIALTFCSPASPFQAHPIPCQPSKLFQLSVSWTTVLPPWNVTFFTISLLVSATYYSLFGIYHPISRY